MDVAIAGEIFRLPARRDAFEKRGAISEITIRISLVLFAMTESEEWNPAQCILRLTRHCFYTPFRITSFSCLTNRKYCTRVMRITSQPLLLLMRLHPPGCRSMEGRESAFRSSL